MEYINGINKQQKVALLISGIAFLLLIAFLLFSPKSEPITTADQEIVEETKLTDLFVVANKVDRNVLNNFTEVSIISNSPNLEAEAFQLQNIGAISDNNYYILTIDKLDVGENNLAVKFTHKDLSKEIEFNITREDFYYPPGYRFVHSWEESAYILDPENYNQRITKEIRIPEDYDPEVVDLNKTYGIYTLNSASLIPDAARDLNTMLRDLRRETGKEVTVASGYRSFNTQVETFVYWVNEVGEKRALEISARPGHSEHQLGTTFDLVNSETNWQIDESFGDTIAGKWIIQNAEKYGFKQFLDENQTDYIPEPWQFRWVSSGGD